MVFSYAITALIAYLGLYVGNILIFLAPEEQKPGKKVFRFIQHLTGGMILLIAAIATYHEMLKFLTVVA